MESLFNTNRKGLVDLFYNDVFGLSKVISNFSEWECKAKPNLLKDMKNVKKAKNKIENIKLCWMINERNY